MFTFYFYFSFCFFIFYTQELSSFLAHFVSSFLLSQLLLESMFVYYNYVIHNQKFSKSFVNIIEYV